MAFYVGEERRFVGPDVDSEENPIVSWAWDFGDGTFGEGQTTTHVYNTPGAYTATLQTVNSCGVHSNPDDPTCGWTITIESQPTKAHDLDVAVGASILSGVAMLGVSLLKK